MALISVATIVAPFAPPTDFDLRYRQVEEQPAAIPVRVVSTGRLRFERAPAG